MSASQGGARGTPSEAARTHAWPSYEAEYLKRRLKTPHDSKYNGGTLEGNAEAVYLDKVTENYKSEADECLKAEFKDWLEGRHEDNVYPSAYINEPGAPVRRYTYHTDIPIDANGKQLFAPGDPVRNGQWQPTWWGKDSLTHLPGVREFLRGERQAGWDSEFQMNMLAEHGPQNVKEAWQYFKHWVKKRPVSDADCDALGDMQNAGWATEEIDNASRFGTMPHHMRARPSIAQQDPPKEADVQDAATAAAAAATAAGNVNLGAGAAAAAAANFDRAESLAQNAIRVVNGEAPIPIDDNSSYDEGGDWSGDDESMPTVDAANPAPRGVARGSGAAFEQELQNKRKAGPRSYADFPAMPNQGQKRRNPDDVSGAPYGRQTKKASF